MQFLDAVRQVRKEFRQRSSQPVPELRAFADTVRTEALAALDGLGFPTPRDDNYIQASL
jgi:hypothetical protein